MENYGVVSVVMPVYGVEKYLSQCLDSVCNQTYPYLEIIVVDDESPDNSGKIADEYAQKDSRIKVLHIKNRGAAGARNVGLDNVTGDYIVFVDSDDWIENDMIEQMLTILANNNCDIVQCQYVDEFLNESKKHSYNIEEQKCSNQDYLGEMISHWEYPLIWNKIFKKEVMQDIRFVEGRCIDDEFYTYKLIMNAKSVYLSNEYFYHYRIRKTSAMRNPEKEKQRFIDQIDFITTRYNDIKNAYTDLKSVFAKHLVEVLMFVMRNGFEYKDVFDRAKAELKKYSKDVIFDNSIDKNIKKSVLTYLVKKSFIPDPKPETQNRDNCFD